MKKTFILFVTLLSSYQLMQCMDKAGSFSKLGQTLYDKWDPTSILGELEKTGISRDKREKMTQTHRLDRIVPYFIERKEPDQLCDSLTQIVTQQWPISSVAQEIAIDYLWKLRPSIRTNKPLLSRVTATLDLLNPAQVIDDMQKGQLYSDEKLELEGRLNRAIEQLVNLGDTRNLKQLIAIIQQRNGQEETRLIPGKRVLQLAYQHLWNQEKETKSHKKMLIATFKAEKNDSDGED